MQARQTPTFERLPHEVKSTDGPMAAKLASVFFGEPLEWQRYVLDVLVARDYRDKYLFHAVALSAPRQNGKSWDILARCFHGLVTEGERILYTCQHGDTADEMFHDLADIFEEEDNEELHALLRTVRKTNGQQAIYLENGGYIRFTTRTNSLARGRSYDVIVYDEAQELTKAQQAASQPTVSASRKHNTQVIYIGTPPNPEAPGVVFTGMHDEAHGEKAPSFAWMEWAADEVGDVTDRSRWYETNPSLGTLIDETAIEGELSMSPDDFARERLGWWTPVKTQAAVIPRELWKKTAIKAIGDKYRSKTALAVKFAPDGSGYALAGAKTNAKGDAAFELVELGSTAGGTKPLAEALAQRKGKVSCVVVDGLNGAGTLCDQLADIGVPRGYVVRPRAGDVVTAATGLLDCLKAGTAAHTTQAGLEASALNATQRPIGRGGGWGFGTDGAHSPGPIEACALALWAVRTCKRNPRRRQRMI
ncbi:MAG: terminase large subunit domain-containing protein [Coriobacteriales bacterium]